LCGKFLLKRIIEGKKIEEKTRKKTKQLLDGLKEKRMYWSLK